MDSGGLIRSFLISGLLLGRQSVGRGGRCGRVFGIDVFICMNISLWICGYVLKGVCFFACLKVYFFFNRNVIVKSVCADFFFSEIYSVLIYM